MSAPQVSLIVPTRNRAEQLEIALASIAAQRTDATFEVIVVDNASTDGTPDVLERWCVRDPRFRSLREERLGRSTAMNAGIAVAAGRLLLFTDDDVELDAGWIDAFARSAAWDPGRLAIAGGPIVAVPADLGSWPAWLSEEALHEGPTLDHGGRERPLEELEFVWGASMAVPADVFDRLGRWDESVGRRGDHRGTFEDTELQARVRAAGGEVWYVPGATLRHRVARSAVTPRRVLDDAYRNGRNAAWTDAVLDAGTGFVAVGRAFARWAAAVAAFRRHPDSSRFEAARSASRDAGTVGESVARRRPRARSTIQHGSWWLARAILRLAPAAP